jgi:hypothetical protein
MSDEAGIPAGFRGAAARLTAEDVTRVAAGLGLPARTVWAVAQVEAAEHGFLPAPDSRPELLFEAHQFHLLTGGRWDAAHPNISAPQWDRSLYGAAGAHQYDRLAEAIALDEAAALQSATWGMFQILGANFALVGYPDIDSFVAAMCDSEGRHLDAFAAYCTARKFVRFLAAEDWMDFALGYNGAGEALNGYAAKLAAAVANGKFPPPGTPPGTPPITPAPPAPSPPPPGGSMNVVEIPLGLAALIPIAGDDQAEQPLPVPPDAVKSADAAVVNATVKDGKTLELIGLAIGQTTVGGLDLSLPVSVVARTLTHLTVDLAQITYAAPR